MSAAALALFAPALAQTDPAPAGAPAAAATAPAPGLGEGVAAIVNDEIISTYDLRQRIMLLILTTGVQPTEQNMPQLQQQALRGLIEEHLELQEVRKQEKKQKFDIVPSAEEIDENINGLAAENKMTGDQLKQSLTNAGISIETLRQQFRAQIAWQRWINGRYGTRLRIGRDQVEAQLKRMAAASSQPRYLIGEIFIENSKAGGAAQALDGAKQLIAQLQQGAPFAAVARQFSGSPTAANGGDAGWVTSAEAPREVINALSTMRAGQLSPPIPVADGVYIIYLREKEAGGAANMVTLKQIAVRLPGDATPEQLSAANRSLQEVAAKKPTCDTLQSAAEGIAGVTEGDLGEANVSELSEAFRTAAQSLPDNQLSAPIRTPVGLHMIEVCGRRQAGAEQPTAQEVEQRLYSQQLALLSRRYLRDLRNSATIETR